MKRKILTLTLVMNMMLWLCACGSPKMEDYVGTYMGDTGISALILNEDGTAVYSEDDSTGTGMGAWKIEDNKIYVSVTNLPYDIYAEITDDGEFLFTTDEGNKWTDEVFTKY